MDTNKHEFPSFGKRPAIRVNSNPCAVFFGLLLLSISLVRAATSDTGPFIPLHSTIVLLSGLPGDLESENAYRDQIQAWLEIAGSRQPKEIVLLCDSPETGSTNQEGRIILSATRSNFLAVADKISKTNPVALIAWGHGGRQGSQPVFHVRGPRITPADVKAFAGRIGEMESRWVLMFRGSGGFARELAGPNRLIISSEGDTTFTSDPIGMPLLLKIARANPETSVKGLAQEFGRATAAWYQERNLARTEEPTLWADRAAPVLLVSGSNENSFASAPSGETENKPSAQSAAIGSNLPPSWEGITRADRKQYPDADAVLLRRRVSYTLASNPALASEQEEFIQILKLEGKRFGDFDISYSPPFEEVNFLDCEVLNNEGKLVRLDPDAVREGRDESVGEYQFGRRKIFSLPGVEPGAVLHVRYQTQWKDFPLPHVLLEIPLAKEMPVLDSTIQVSVPKESPFHFAFENLPSDDRDASRTEHGRITDPQLRQGNYGTSYTWHFRELPARRHEVLQPPGQRARLLISTFADWAAFAAWYSRISQLADEVTPEIEAKAKELTKEAKTDRDKVLALYDYVARLRYVAVPLGINSFRPHAAANVLKNQYGDCKDKANLLNSLLRALNLEAHLVLVPRFGQVHESIPGLSFNHAISKVKLGEQELWIDTTDEVCRFGMLPPGDAGRKVLVIDGQTSRLSQLPVPPASEHQLKLRGEITVGRASIPSSTNGPQSETGGNPVLLHGTLNATARGFPDYELRASAREVKEHDASLPLLEASFGPTSGSFALEKQSATPVSALDEDFAWNAAGDWVGLATDSAGQHLLRAPFFLPKEWTLALHRRQAPLFLNEGYPLSLDEEFSFEMQNQAEASVLPKPIESKTGVLHWRIEWLKPAQGKLTARLTAELGHGELTLEETSRFQKDLTILLNALAAGVSWEIGR